MPHLVLAYSVIFVVLVAYGVTLYRRMRQTDAALRVRDEKEQ